MEFLRLRDIYIIVCAKLNSRYNDIIILNLQKNAQGDFPTTATLHSTIA